MKHLFLIKISMLICILVTGQSTMNIYKNNGDVLVLPIQDIDSVTTTNLSTISTLAIDSNNAFFAYGGGIISSDGDHTILQRGVCWSTSPNPTIEDNFSIDGNGMGNFTSKLINLHPNTLFYYRAYMKTDVGVFYGDEKLFITKESCFGLSSMTDDADKTYSIIEIGNQCWMAENLDYAVENSWCYNNDSLNCEIYGRLYDWHAAMNACPDGWYLPGKDEFGELFDYLGNNAGGKMKSTSNLWNSPNTNATNESGFSGLPGGYLLNSNFHSIGQRGYWWTSSLGDIDNSAKRYSLSSSSGVVTHIYISKASAYSVRCVRGY